MNILCKWGGYNALKVILFCVLVGSALLAAISYIKACGEELYGVAENPEVLDIQTYLAGDNQPTHPSIIDMKERWNGYRYWMSYSPYPYGNGEEENPCIAISNDLKTWTNPKGLHNPIAFNEETSCDELKDPHILYNPNENVMEVWYLGRLNGTLKAGDDLMLFRKVSRDGVKWSDYEILIPKFNGKLSPSVIWEDGKYKLFSIQPNNATKEGTVVYSESVDGKTWGEERALNFGNKPSIDKIWHGSIAKDSVYRFVFIPSRDADKILYAESKDGYNYSEPKEIIKMGHYRSHFYRPFAFVSDSKFVCIYGVVDYSNKWGLSLTIGNTPNSLEMFDSPKAVDHVKYRFVKMLRTSVYNIMWIAVGFLCVLSVILSLVAKNIKWIFTSMTWLIYWILIYVSSYRFSFGFDSQFWINLFISGVVSLVLWRAMKSFEQLR